MIAELEKKTDISFFLNNCPLGAYMDCCKKNKDCCKKFKEGKRCKKCPGRKK